jgi:hypothetical protein
MILTDATGTRAYKPPPSGDLAASRAEPSLEMGIGANRKQLAIYTVQTPVLVLPGQDQCVIGAVVSFYHGLRD